MQQSLVHLDLAQESIGSKGRCEFRAQDFQGHESVSLGVARQVHQRGSPTADLALDAIARGEFAAQDNPAIAHRCASQGTGLGQLRT